MSPRALLLPVLLVVGAIVALALAGPQPAAVAEDAAEHAFVSVKGCKKCHFKQWSSWKKTAHYKTLDILKPGERAEAKTKAGLDPNKDYTTDKTCLPCHVTGYGEPGGFVDEASSPNLLGVGCEACHGPGGTYTKSQYMSLKNKEYKKSEVVAVGMVDTVSEAQCTPCHNAESPFVGDDFVFDFEANKDKGTHAKFPLKYEH